MGVLFFSVEIESKSSVILNGIECGGFPKWSVSDCARGVVGTAGELRYKKGIFMLTKAYGNIPASIKSELRLVGRFSDKLEERKCDDLAFDMGVATEVRKLGYMEREQLLSEISQFNVFVLPSLHDGMPNALLEAAACGIPIVAARVGGMADVLVHEENCLLFEPGDVEGLSRSIERALSDTRLCQKLSMAALELSHNLNIVQEGESWVGLYSKLIECK